MRSPSGADRSLGASVAVRSTAGRRALAVRDVARGLFESTLEPVELITGVSVPPVAGATASAFEKLDSNANDLAIVNAAVALERGEDGTCAAAHLVVGGGMSRTARVTSAERVLQGSRLDADALSEAAAAAPGDVEPASDHRASAPYRKAMAAVLVRRALERAIERLG